MLPVVNVFFSKLVFPDQSEAGPVKMKLSLTVTYQLVFFSVVGFDQFMPEHVSHRIKQKTVNQHCNNEFLY